LEVKSAPLALGSGLVQARQLLADMNWLVDVVQWKLTGSLPEYLFSFISIYASRNRPRTGSRDCWRDCAGPRSNEMESQNGRVCDPHLWEPWTPSKAERNQCLEAIKTFLPHQF
jgi:hypothetical protein